MSIEPPKPVRLISGGLSRDHRGVVQHVNAFRPAGADRFYVLHPARVGEVRGWVGHRRDAKWFFVVTGAVEVGVVAPDSWPQPSRALAVQRYSLKATEPAVLDVPPGHFTAMIAREPESAVVVFSTGFIESAKEDDYRLPADYWAF